MTLRSKSCSWRSKSRLSASSEALRLLDLRFDHGDLRRPLALPEIGELRLGALQFRLGLRDRVGRFRGVDKEEQRAGLDLVAAPDGDLQNAAADFRRHLDELAFDVALKHCLTRTVAAGGEEQCGKTDCEASHLCASRMPATMARTFCFSSTFT